MTIKKKEATSRREFVQGITGAAFAGALAAAPCLGKTAVFPSQNAAAAAAGGERLVAPCGLYCGACPMYLASQEKDEAKFKDMMRQFTSGKMQFKQEDLLCDGCIGGGRVAVFCRNCAMRTCADEKAGVTRCSDCAEFPCSKITNFNNDGMLHHSEVLANLRQIRQMGIKEWTRFEEDRWSCPKCRNKISWYDKACSKCGASRSERLFPLKQV